MIITLEVQHVTVVFAAGPVNGPSKMRHVMDKNQDIQNSYLKAVDELGVLRDNLLKKEVRAPRQPAQERGTRQPASTHLPAATLQSCGDLKFTSNIYLGIKKNKFALALCVLLYVCKHGCWQ